MGVLSRYRELLPITPRTPHLSLGEGNTPLLRSRRLEKEVGCGELYFKLEGCNPTGSFKDRGMVLAVAKAVEAGSKAILCASTGNTSASAAAYAAHAGVQANVIVPYGSVAMGKFAQVLLYNARVVSIEGTFDEALELARSLAQKHPVTLVNSINPYRIEGQKTAAFEIVDALGDAPDLLFIPVGNAGNITAYWKGFVEYQQRGLARQRPRMMGYEAEGAAPIAQNRVILEPKTVATAIRIGNPASWKGAVAAKEESGGCIGTVTDDEILAAYRLLASAEGIFGEPASAVSLAGLLRLAREGGDLRGKRVVCIITGSGLKDPETAVHLSPHLPQVPSQLQPVEEALGWG